MVLQLPLSVSYIFLPRPSAGLDPFISQVIPTKSTHMLQFQKKIKIKKIQIINTEMLSLVESRWTISRSLTSLLAISFASHEQTHEITA